MKPNSFNRILGENASLNPAQIREVEGVVKKYPYFQAARALQLKGYYDTDNLSYPAVLHKTAAYTTDRSVLFEFITAPVFKQQKAADRIKNTKPVWRETAAHDFDRAVTMKKGEAEQVLDPGLFEERKTVPAEEEKVGEKPLASAVPEKTENTTEEQLPVSGKNKDTKAGFDKTQSHSFSEWLKMTSSSSKEKKKDAQPQKKTRKNEIIDNFIDKNPRITPQPSAEVPVSIKEYTPDKALMTETLANIYAEQKNYQKAIQAYKILILKNPEKSGLFANRIREIENKENKKQ